MDALMCASVRYSIFLDKNTPSSLNGQFSLNILYMKSHKENAQKIRNLS